MLARRSGALPSPSQKKSSKVGSRDRDNFHQPMPLKMEELMLNFPAGPCYIVDFVFCQPSSVPDFGRGEAEC